MKKIEKIYEGKAKILYSTENPNLLIQYFKDDTTAFNGEKKEILTGKGEMNNLISAFLMQKLFSNKIPCHFIKRLSSREQLIKKLNIIPLEVIIRNISAGSISKRLGINEGVIIDSPIIEFCYKSDLLADPLINDDHITKLLKILNQNQLNKIKFYALRINTILQELFNNINITIVDFKIEFGFSNRNTIILADEISPDSARLWDKSTNEKLDKDRFRCNLGGVVESYKIIAERFGIINSI